MIGDLEWHRFRPRQYNDFKTATLCAKKRPPFYSSNNWHNVEKWLLDFCCGYSIQVRLAFAYKLLGIQAIDVKFSKDLAHQKSLKSVNFWQSYLKNKKVDVFSAHSVDEHRSDERVGPTYV